MALHLCMCCSLCVCSLGLPDSVYPPKSPPIRIGDPCVRLRPPTLRREGTLKLWFLSSLSVAAGATHRLFPLQLIKSPYQTVWSIFCIPWLKNFLSAKIPLIVQVNNQKISRKSELGARASGLSFHLLGCHLPPGTSVKYLLASFLSAFPTGM